MKILILIFSFVKISDEIAQYDIIKCGQEHKEDV